MTTRNHLARPALIKLARRGRLVDEAFKVFQRAVYPGAPPDQAAAMRTCFFAGAAELLAIMAAAADASTDDPTAEDLDVFDCVATELTRFHERTIRAASARADRGQA